MTFHAYVANVVGDDLIPEPMPVESDPTPYRPDGGEGLLVLYGDAEGVTVVVAAADFDDAERRIVATFGDAVYVDDLQESHDQRPLSIALVAGLVPNEEAARKLLKLDAENSGL